MEYSLSWLEKEYLTYVNNQSNKPFFLSDYNVNTKRIAYPENIIKTAFLASEKKSNYYSYVDGNDSIKGHILRQLRNYDNTSLTFENIAINLNSTNSIYLTLVSLEKLNHERFLVVTPTYYTVLDTLKQLKKDITYFHLLDEENFEIDIELLRNTLISQYIEVLVITDPIYSAGIELTNCDVTSIVNVCNELDICLMYDYTLGGNLWGDYNYLMNWNKYVEITKLNKFIIIDSLSKKLFINGIKHSYIIASSCLVEEIEDLFYSVSGGFCNVQIELFSELFKPQNSNVLSVILNENAQIAARNFRLLRSLLADTNYMVYPTNSGYFTILTIKDKKIKDVDVQMITKHLLHQYDIYAYPNTTLSYYLENKFGFRVNLLSEFITEIPSLVECIDKYFK
jgi:aspartate/methionine/tyrosine aminotransferase